MNNGSDKTTRGLSAEHFTAIFGAILLANYGVWLATPSAQLLTSGLAVLCVVLIVIYSGSEIRRKHYFFAATFVAGCLLLFFHPITQWDARSIWFYHAKRMYFDGSIGARLDGYPGWNHPDYPDLVPALAASITRATGIWNEILPKTSLVLALAPPMAILLARAHRFGERLFLLGVILTATGNQLIGGSMDAILALYATAEIVLLSERLTNRSSPATQFDTTTHLVLLACLACLKNEGLVIALILGVPFVMLLHRHRHEGKFIAKVAATGILVALPVLTWKTMLHSQTITSDLFGSQTVSLILGRLASGDWLIVLSELGKNVVLPAAIFLTWRIIGGPVRPVVIYFSAIYFIVLAMVYLGTPHDLAWHLSTSVNRVTLVIRLSVMVSFLLFLQDKFGHAPGKSVPVA